jgi:hypothetical protein
MSLNADQTLHFIYTKLIVSIPTSFNCNKVLGYPEFQ